MSKWSSNVFRGNELVLINIYHCHCKCPCFWFPNMHFILSPTHRTCSHPPRGGNLEILSALKLAQSLGFLSELSIYICMWLFIVQQAMN